MKKEYDFEKGKRGPVIAPQGKTRITIYLDDDILEEFRKRAEEAGRGCQTMINDVLRMHLGRVTRPIDEKSFRRVIREELRKAG